MHEYALARLADPMLEGQSWSSRWLLGCSFLYLQSDFAARLAMLLMLKCGPAASSAIWDMHKEVQVVAWPTLSLAAHVFLSPLHQGTAGMVGKR